MRLLSFLSPSVNSHTPAIQTSLLLLFLSTHQISFPLIIIVKILKLFPRGRHFNGPDPTAVCCCVGGGGVTCTFITLQSLLPTVGDGGGRFYFLGGWNFGFRPAALQMEEDVSGVGLKVALFSSPVHQSFPKRHVDFFIDLLWFRVHNTVQQTCRTWSPRPAHHYWPTGVLFKICDQ